jgi:hypothetical protein
MTDAFTQTAIKRLVAKAAAAGVPIPPAVDELLARIDHGEGSHASREWARLHPDEDLFCCDAVVYRDAASCTCWVPVFDVEQAPPEPLVSIGDLAVRAGGMCGDCAYRPGSPEREQEFMADTLMEFPAEGTPFFCHDGIRRPVAWVHPDGHTLPGHPDDYQPAVGEGGYPYRADGRPALLCAGWAAIAARSDG